MQIDRCPGLLLRPPPLIRLAALILLTGCAADRSAEDVLGDLPVWTLEETLRIGDLEDPDLGFSNVGPVRVAPDGRIFVVESQERQIRVFDPQGRGLTTLGGHGDGPGEFQFPTSMGILGDTLWVRDMMAQRTTIFSLAGELLRTLPTQPVNLELGDPPIRLMVSPDSPRPDGTFAASYSVMIDPDAKGESRTVRAPRLRFNAAGEVLDTVGWYQYAVPAPLLLRMGEGLAFTAQPLSDVPLQVGREGARWIVERPIPSSADDAALTIVSTGEDDADTLFVRTFPYRPIAIDAELADSLRESLIEEFVNDGFPEADARRAIGRNVIIPDFLPPVTLGLLGEDASLWLRREEDQADHWRWNVFAPDGEPIGIVRTPRSFDVRVAGRDRIWGVHTDDYGVPWVVRYRLVRDVV